MAKILSQDEVDRLLAGLGGGEVVEAGSVEEAFLEDLSRKKLPFSVRGLALAGLFRLRKIIERAIRCLSASYE